MYGARARSRLLAAVALAAALVSPTGLGAQRKAAPAKADPLAGLDASIEKVRTDWHIVGLAVGIVKDDSLIYAKGFGLRDAGKPDSVDANTIFAIGSNTKSFTSTAAAMLVDDGKLKWDDKVIDRYPGFQLYDPYVTREITIRDILSHRAGLGRRGDALWYGTTYSRDEIIRRVRYLTPNAGFRTEMGYQNIMFLTAGEIVGKVSGLGWDGFMKQRIFAPLGMTRSSTSIRELAGQADVATPHSLEDGVGKPIPWRSADNIAPAGSINSSVAEMANYLRMHLKDGEFRGTRLVSKAHLGVTKTPHINTGGAGDSLTHFSAYGLGWVLLDYRGKKLVWHNGGIDGMLSEMWTVPEAGLGIIVLTNTAPHGAGPAIVRDIIDRYLVGAPTKDWNGEALKQYQQIRTMQEAAQRRLDSARLRDTKPSLPLASYAGTYDDDLYGELAVSVEGGQLVVQWAGRRAVLDHWHLNTFRSAGEGGGLGGALMATFRINAMGKVAEVDVEGIGTFRARAAPQR